MLVDLGFGTGVEFKSMTQLGGGGGGGEWVCAISFDEVFSIVDGSRVRMG
jgi:hypothetical protein